jgi:Do/DeqQ family serine protease
MRRRLLLVTVVAVAAAAGIAVSFSRDADQTASPPATAAAPATQVLAETQSAPAGSRASVPESREAIRLSFAPIVKRVAPAVVNVYATSRVQVRSPFEGDPFFERFFGGGIFGGPQQRERSSLGSGVIVDPTGVVVTNNHVVGEATEVKVALSDGREYQAKILLKDERTDLAILKIDNGREAFPVLQFGNSDALEVGDLVLAVGNPFGVGQTVTSGIVSAVARTNLGINDSGFFIQTDAAINPGNSGGALVDVDGNLVGINTAIYSRSGGSIGIGFAVPADMVKTVVAQAVAGSSTVARTWIGVVCQDVTPDIASSLGIASPRGALVAHVDEDSPGGKAGLKVGDLILKAGDRDIGDAAAFDYRLAVTGIGNSVALQIWRDGSTIPISVTPEAEPQLDEADLTLIGGRSPLTGAVVADLSASLADRLQIRGVEAGAVIVDIEPMSPAARVGFQTGDVLLRVQGEDVATAKRLAELAEANSRVWRISFNRGGQVSSIVIGG